MIHDPDLKILTEDLSDAPVHAQLRDTVLRLIEASHEPKAVVDALLTVSMAMSVQVDGPEMTAIRFVAAGKVLAASSAESLASTRRH